MARSYADAFLPLLYNALEEEIGLFVRTNDRVKLVNTLYEARQKAGDEALDELMLFQPETDVVFIAKRSTELHE
jgi:hypothetical protein